MEKVFLGELNAHMNRLKELHTKLTKESRKVYPETSLELQRGLVKEAQKINDELKLIEETKDNPVEVKVYVYEMYNSIPADLEKIYEKIAEEVPDMKRLEGLRKAIDEVSSEIEKFWYFVNK